MKQLIINTLNAIYYTEDINASCIKCKQQMVEQNYTKEQQNDVETSIITYLLNEGFNVTIPLFK